VSGSARVNARQAGSGSGSRSRWGRDATVVARAVLAHPSLWWASVGALRRLARRGWWHRAPFVPLPGEAYWRFRLVTAYGGDGETEVLTSSDVVAYLRWCQRSRPRRG
jgi:hypothetical protein